MTRRKVPAAFVLALLLAACDPMAADPSSSGTHRDGSEADTYRDAQNLTRWCEDNGLCDEPPSWSLETTTTAKGNSW